MQAIGGYMQGPLEKSLGGPGRLRMIPAMKLLGKPTDGNFQRCLVAIVLFAFACRIGARIVAGTDGYWSSGYSFYAALAESLAAGRGYAFPGEGPTAFRVPLYPLFIAAVTFPVRSTWVFLGAQALISCGTVVCTALIGRRLFGAMAGLAAAALCALYPYYVWHDLALQETGLFTFLTVLGTLLLLELRERRRAVLAVGAGIVLACAILTRATLVPFALCAIVWLMMPDRRATPLARRLGGAAVVLAAFLLALAPWLIRSERLTGTYGLGTEFGAALYAGNHALTFSSYPERSIDEIRHRILAEIAPEGPAHSGGPGYDEVALGNRYAAEAVEAMAAHPVRTLTGAMRKLWAAFGPMPSPRHSTLVNLAYCMVWMSVLVAGVAGLWLERKNWRRDSLFYAHFVTFAAVSAALWAHTSHRSYLDVYLIVFAAGALQRLWHGRAMAVHFPGRLELPSAAFRIGWLQRRG